MAELSDHDKRILLGPNYREIEAREAKNSGMSEQVKSTLVVAVFVALTSVVLVASLSVEYGL